MLSLSGVGFIWEGKSFPLWVFIMSSVSKGWRIVIVQNSSSLKTSSCIFLRCCTKITHNNLKLFWFTWGSFEISKLVYLHAQLGEKTYRIRLAWEAYCNWYFEAPKWIDCASLKETNYYYLKGFPSWKNPVRFSQFSLWLPLAPSCSSNKALLLAIHLSLWTFLFLTLRADPCRRPAILSRHPHPPL